MLWRSPRPEGSKRVRAPDHQVRGFRGQKMASVNIPDVAIHPEWVGKWKACLSNYAGAQADHALTDAETYPEEQAEILPDGSLLIFIPMQEHGSDEGPRLVVPPSAWMLESPGY